ncbi:MAG: FG-GAP-like repeat-containing protein [Bacteroidota bacterium]|nr:FG-GAP-like repeat-containing protein [Bacteroidota bacterium]
MKIFNAQICLFFTLIWSSGNSQISFNRTDYNTDNGGDDMVIADFTNDGYLDYAVTNLVTNSINIFTNSGNGTFTKYLTFSNVGIQPNSPRNADLNNDGFIDLVSVGYITDKVYININNGNGIFTQSEINLYSPARPRAVRIYDINKDNLLDLLITNEYDGKIAVFLGNGNGTFGVPSYLSLSGKAYGLWVEDVDNDSNLDILTCLYYVSQIAIIYGNGNGTFISPTYFSAGINPQSIISFDINGDSRKDIIWTNVGNDNFSVMTRNNGRTFNSPTSYSVGDQPRYVLNADMNGDLIQDVVVSNFGSASITIYTVSGIGSINFAGTFSGIGNPYGFDIADLNGDLKKDIVVSNYNTLTSVFLQNNLCLNFNISLQSSTFTRCGPGLIIVNPTPTANHNWYTTSNGGSSFQNSSSYSTNISSSTTYYVTSTTSIGCESNRVPVYATINPLPPNPIAYTITHCGASLFVVTNTGGPILNWYTNSTIISSFSNQSSFNTQILSKDTTFYISSSNGTCNSSRYVVNINIYPIPPTPTISVSGKTNFCKGEVITLTASLSSNYLWNTNATTPRIFVSKSGQYFLNVFNNFNCISNASTPIAVEGNDSIPKNFLGTDFETCRTDTVLSTNILNADTYLWTIPTNITLSGSAIFANVVGNYILYINKKGCEGLDTIGFKNKPIQFKLGPNIATCKKINFLSTNLLGTQYTYQWKLPSGNTLTGKNIQSTEKGEFILEISKNGCVPAKDSIWIIDKGSVLSNINIANYLIDLNDWETTPIIYALLPIDFEVKSDSNLDKYQWIVNEQNNSKDSIYSFKVTQEGLVTIKFKGIDKDSCISNLEKSFIIKEVSIPNVITPNNDGINDRLQINCNTCQNSINLQIFNRWGTQVFESDSYKNYWKAENCAEGIYFYTATLSQTNISRTFNGWIQVLR